jgi:TonB family protein
MMRLFLLPTVLCLPLLLHGQTSETKQASLVAKAESSYVPPASTSSAPAAPSPVNTTKPVRPVFEGIVPPKLVHTLAMKDDGNQHVHISGRERTVVVELTVNETGEPTELRIPEPVDDALDVEVLATVGKFRYRPGTLNGRPIPMTVRMRYVVPVGAIY